MNLESFTFFVTEECNFDCAYCYQVKGKNYSDLDTIKRAVDFFYPLFSDKCLVNFYGGEPLLAFDRIKETVGYIQEKEPGKELQFGITSNGSLLDDEALEFFNDCRFSLLLSFDGLAQDMCRRRGSFHDILAAVKRIKEYPGIDLEINSVFTPDTVDVLAESLALIIGLDIHEISLSLATVMPWDQRALLRLAAELKTLKETLKSIYKEGDNIPVTSFRKNRQKGVFGCSAGKNSLTLAADGKLWGCYLFTDYFKGKEETKEYQEYCFGDLDFFIENHQEVYPKVLANYADLRMDYFDASGTLCLFCDELAECQVCPANAALSGASIGEIPSWICRIHKIIRQRKREFWQEVAGGSD